MKQIRAAHSAVTDEAFEALVEASIEAAEPLTRAAVKRGLPHVARATGQDDDYYTPAPMVEAARAAMGGIDLDPASSAEAQNMVRAARYHTAEDDGLAHPWAGRVFLNPPYSQPLIARFIAKLLESVEVEQWIALVNNATETGWGSALLERCDHVCFVRGRVQFVRPDSRDSRPLQGQMIAGRGMTRRRFTKHFGGFGPCK